MRIPLLKSLNGSHSMPNHGCYGNQKESNSKHFPHRPLFENKWDQSLGDAFSDEVQFVMCVGWI